MSIIRFRPQLLDPFEAAERFFGEDAPRGFVPALDVYQTKDAVVVEMPLAGVDPDDVEVSIEDNILTLKGETKRKTEIDDENFYRKEVRYGSFHRQVALPVPVIGEKAEAISKDGLLKISVPKVKEEETKPLKIKIAKQ
jgi:HSP20 family protein